MANAEQHVVKNLDVKRYMGKWYEIASFLTFFEPESYVDSTATYKLNPNGTFHVLNESREKDGGNRVSIEGLGYKADPNTNETKFKVTLNVFPFDQHVIPIAVTGDYWVLYVDVDYQRTLIGHPSREYLWIMNRTPQLDEKTYDDLVMKAGRQGYDVTKIDKRPQSEGR